jgi:hypothetical protein
MADLEIGSARVIERGCGLAGCHNRCVGLPTRSAEKMIGKEIAGNRDTEIGKRQSPWLVVSDSIAARSACLL